MQKELEIEFEELLARNSPMICKICWVYGEGDGFFFEELREQCVIELWQEFSRYGTSRFRGECKESTWVYRLALHAVGHYFRDPRHAALPTFEGVAEGLPIEAEDFDVEARIGELSRQLSAQEKLFLVHYLDNHSYAEIAEQDHISEAAARKRMSRLMLKQKMLIQNDCL